MKYLILAGLLVLTACDAGDFAPAMGENGKILCAVGDGMAYLATGGGVFNAVEVRRQPQLDSLCTSVKLSRQ